MPTPSRARCKGIRASINDEAETARGRLKSLKRLLLFAANYEQLVQLGNREHFEDLRVDVAQNQLAAGRLDLLVQRDKHAQYGARHVFDVAEVQKQLLVARFFYKIK